MSAAAASPSLVLQSDTRSLVSIQILRAVAALAVLLDHVSYHLIDNHADTPNLVLGAAGVDLFFVISGFVMVYASEPLFGWPGASRVFFFRRLARIVPLYWVTTLVLVGYGMAAGLDSTRSWEGAKWIVSSFLFIPYPRPNGVVLPYAANGWTLNYEMFFYAIFAVAILLARSRAVIAITMLFAMLCILGRANSELPSTLAYWCDPLVLEFCLGMVLALAYRARMRLPLSLAAGLVALGAATLGYTEFRGYEPSWRVVEYGLPAAAIVAGMSLSRSAPPVGRLARAFVVLGDASFALYLIHPIVILMVRRGAAPFLSLPAHPWLYGTMMIAASIVASIACYRLFERPLTRALQRRIGGLPGTIVTVAPSPAATAAAKAPVQQ
jgi:peptidoglycan/LPS O-acetylase OafA/YrhL